MPLRVLGAELEAPGGDGPAHAFGQPVVAGEDIVETFVEQQVDRGPQCTEHVERRRIGEEAVLVGAHHVIEVEVAAAHAGLLAGGQRLLRHAEDGEARRHHEALLRARDADVHAPFVHAEVDGGERAHGIDEEQGRVVCLVHGAAHGGNIAGDAGGRLIVSDEHGLVAVAACRP